jgi:hypothetical protein
MEMTLDNAAEMIKAHQEKPGSAWLSGGLVQMKKAHQAKPGSAWLSGGLMQMKKTRSDHATGFSRKRSRAVPGGANSAVLQSSAKLKAKNPCQLAGQGFF